MYGSMKSQYLSRERVSQQQGSDLQNKEKKLFSPILGQFSLMHGCTKKRFCLPVGQIFCFVVLFFVAP